jgi:non-ribosomal peptide synthetase component F
MFSLLSLTAQRQGEDPGTGWQAHDTAREASQFDLMLSLEEAPLGYAAKWEFNSDLFDTVTIERMATHYERLLRHGLCRPQAPLQQLEMLDAAERDAIVHRFDDTALTYEPQCLHHMIEAHVERAPQAIAAVFEESTLSYAQLNEQANRLAHHLRSLGIGPDDRIAVCVARGLSMVVALVAVLKTGAAYVPLDPDYPAERLAFMIEDCQPSGADPGGHTCRAACGCGGLRLHAGPGRTVCMAAHAGRQLATDDGRERARLCDLHVRLDGRSQRSDGHARQRRQPVHGLRAVVPFWR